MNEPRKINKESNYILVIALVTFPLVLIFGLFCVSGVFRFVGYTDMVLSSIVITGLYFSVYFVYSVVMARNPHWVTGLFTVGMLCWAMVLSWLSMAICP
jgi:hypothetical protein